MPEPEATEATIKLMYQSLLRGNGRGRRTARASRPIDPSGDGQRHRLQAPASPAQAGRAEAMAGPDAKPRLPVALIFACLVVVYVGIRYFLR